MYLVKTEANGNQEWTSTFGGTGYDAAHSVQQTSDGGYILVGHNEDWEIYLVKTDATGNRQWSRTFGEGGGATGQQTSDGGYILAALIRCCDSFGNNYAVHLLKTDAAGNQQWSKTFGEDDVDSEGWASVQQTSDGGYIVSASEWDTFLYKTDANGNQQWTSTFENISTWTSPVQQTSDGGYILAGNIYPGDSSIKSIHLVKTDAAGNQQWSRTFGGPGDDQVRSVQQTSDGGYILAGYTESYGAGNTDMYLVKTDATGNQEWHQFFGGTDWDDAFSVQQTSDGGYILVGYTGSYGAGGYDMYLVRTNGL
jgi:hypothetical protein